MSDGIKVAIRMRPLIQRERQSEQGQSRWQVQDNTVSQLDEKGHSAASYTFDRVFDECDTTNDLYGEIVAPIVSSAMAGFHGTVFAYGQTSSGKTFTMVGSKLQPGIIPFAIDAVFDAIQNTPEREFLLRASYLEIYNEKISDLLSPEEKNLKIQLDQNSQPTVPNLTERILTCSENALDILKEGNARKRVGETTQNEKSSRSHCIYKMVIESRERIDDFQRSGEEAVMVSHLNFVDLAGSEKAGENSGERLKEGCAINRSLFCLSNVISKLSEGPGGQDFINYRDSKLTRILQNALGGNSKTAIICTATPASLEETHSTLRFASRAKVIKNKPLVNEVLSDAALIKRYKKEIDRLKKQLAVQEAPTQSSVDSELRLQLEEKEKQHREQLDKLKKLFCVSTLPSPEDCPVPTKKMRRETWCPGPSVGFRLPPLVSQRGTDNSFDKLNWSRPNFGNTSSVDFLAEWAENSEKTHNLLSIPEESEKEEFITSSFPVPVTVTAEVCCQTDPFLLNLPSDHSEQEFEDLRSQLEQSMNICEKLLFEREIKEKNLQEAQQEVLQLSEKVSDLEDQLIRVTCHLDKKDQEFKELEEFTRYEKEFRTPKAKRIKLSPDSKNCQKLEEEILIQQKNATDAETVVMETRKELAISRDHVKDLEKQLAETKKQLDQLSKEKADFDYLMEHEKEKSEKLQKNLRVELQTAYEEIRQLEQMKSSGGGLIKKNDPLLHQLAELQEKVGNLDVSVVVSERDELKEQLSDARAAVQTAEEECQEKTNECSTLMAELADLKESVKELSSDLLDSQDECFKLAEELNSAKKEIAEKSQMLEKLQSCHTSSTENNELVKNSEIEASSPHNSSPSANVIKLQRELQEKTASIISGKEELKQTLEKVENLTEENEILLEKYTDLEERLIAATEEEDRLNEKIKKLTESLDPEKHLNDTEKPGEKASTLKETILQQEDKIQTLSEMLNKVQDKLTAGSEELDKQRQDYTDLETKYLLILKRDEERNKLTGKIDVLNCPLKSKDTEEHANSSFSGIDKFEMDCTEQQENESITEADRLKQLIAEKGKSLEELNNDVKRKEVELIESNKKFDSLVEEYEALLKTQPMDKNESEESQCVADPEKSVNDKKEEFQELKNLVHVESCESEKTSSDSDESHDVKTHCTVFVAQPFLAEESSSDSELAYLRKTLQEQEALTTEMTASLEESKDTILEKEKEISSLTKVYEDLLSRHKQFPGTNADMPFEDKSLKLDWNQLDDFTEDMDSNKKPLAPEQIDAKSELNTTQLDDSEVAGLKDTVEKQQSELLDLYVAVEKAETELIKSRAALNDLKQKYSDLLEKLSEKSHVSDDTYASKQLPHEHDLEKVYTELEKAKAELQIANERIATLESVHTQDGSDENVEEDLSSSTSMKAEKPILTKELSVQTETVLVSEGNQQGSPEPQGSLQKSHEDISVTDSGQEVVAYAEEELSQSQSELAEVYAKLATLQAKYDDLMAQHGHLLTSEKKIKVHYQNFVLDEGNEHMDDNQSSLELTAKSGIEQTEREFVTEYVCKGETCENSDTSLDVEITTLRKVIHMKQIELAEAVDALEKANCLLQESQSTVAALKTENEHLQAKCGTVHLCETSQTKQHVSLTDALHSKEPNLSDIQVTEEQHEAKTTKALDKATADLQANHTSCQTVVGSAPDLTVALNNVTADLQASNEKLTALQSQYDELLSHHNSQEPQVEDSSDISELKMALNKTTADLQASNEKLTALQAQYDELLSHHNSQEPQVEDSSDISELKMALNKTTADLQASNEKLTALQSQYDELLSHHNSQKPQAEDSSDISELKMALNKATADLQASSEKLTALQSQYDELLSHHNSQEPQAEDSSDISELKMALNKTTADLQASNEKLTALQAQYDELLSHHNSQEPQAEDSLDISELKMALNKTTADLQASNEKSTALQSQYDELLSHHNSQEPQAEDSSDISELKMALNKTTADLQASNEKLTALQSQYDELLSHHNSREPQAEDSSDISELKMALNKTTADLQASNEKLTALQSQYDELLSHHNSQEPQAEDSSDMSKLKMALNKTTADLQASNEKLTALQAQYDELLSHHNSQESQVEDSSDISEVKMALNKTTADLQASNEKLTALQSQYDELLSHHNSQEPQVEDSSDISELKMALNKATADLQASNEKLTALQSQYDELLSHHNSQEPQVEDSADISELKMALNKATADLQASNEKLTALQAQYDELLSHHNSQELQAEDSVDISELKMALNKATADLQASNEKLTALQAQYDELLSHHNSQEPQVEDSSDISELKMALNKATADLQASNEKLTALQSQYDELLSHRNSQEPQAEDSLDISELKMALNKTTADLQASNEKLTALQAQYDELLSHHNSREPQAEDSADISELKMALNKATADLQASNEKLTALQSQYDELLSHRNSQEPQVEDSSDISELKMALNKATADLQASNEKLTALQSQYDELLSHRNSQEPQVEDSSDISELKMALNKATADVQASDEKLTALQSQYDELLSHRNSQEPQAEDSSDISELKMALNKATADLQASYEKLTALQSQYDELLPHHNRQEPQAEDSADISELKMALNKTTADFQASNEKLTALQSQYDELQTLHQAVVTSMEVSSSEFGMTEALDKAMADLQASNEKLSTLQSQYDELQTLHQTLVATMDASSNVLDKTEAMANLQVASEKLSTLQLQYDELQRLYESKETSTDVETSELREALNKATRDLQARDEKLSTLQAQFDELQSIHEMSALEGTTNISELRKALDIAKSDLQVSHEQLSVLKAQHDEALSSLKCKLTSESSEMAAALETAKVDFEDCNEKLKDLQSRYDELVTFQDVPSREGYMAEKVTYQEIIDKLKCEMIEKDCALNSTKTELCECKEMVSEKEQQLVSLKETINGQQTELTAKADTVQKLEKELQDVTQNFTGLQHEHEESLKRHAEQMEKAELELLENSKKLVDLRSTYETEQSVKEERNSLIDQVEKLKLELCERNSALAKAEEEVVESVRKQNDLNSKHEVLLEKYNDLLQKEADLQQLLQSAELLKTEISENLASTKDQLENLQQKYEQEKSSALQEQGTFVTGLQEEIEKKASLLLLAENQLKEIQAKLDAKRIEYNMLYEKYSELTEDLSSKDMMITKMSSEIEIKSKELEDKKMEIKSMEKGFEALESELRRKYDKAVMELETLRKSLEQTQGKLEEHVAKERAQDKQYNRIVANFELAQQKVQTLSEKCAQLESQITIEKEKGKDLEAEKRKVEEELKSNQGKVEAMHVESSSMLRQELEKLQQGILGRSKEESHLEGLLRESRTECSKLQEELKAAVREKDQLKSQLDNLSKTQSEKNYLQNQLSHIMSLLEDLRQNKNHLQAKLTKAQAENEKLKSAPQGYEKAELETEVGRLRDELYKAKQQANQKAQDGDLQAKLSEKEAALDELREEVTSLQHTCNTLKDQLEEKTQALDKAKADCEAKESNLQKMMSYLNGQKPMEEMKLKMELRDLQKENEKLKKRIQMGMELQADADTTIMSREEEIEKLKDEITNLREQSSTQSTDQTQMGELSQMRRITSLMETVDQKNNEITSLKRRDATSE
ncbi:centromere-associated protein E-like [Liolophura sinensis]|uniref:centromere-associated protein E-like n=1 Tax=Liolophura sinensis TaxID=3198878 RepID=UPI00315930B1